MGGLSVIHLAILGIIIIAIGAGVAAMLGGRAKPPK